MPDVRTIAAEKYVIEEILGQGGQGIVYRAVPRRRAGGRAGFGRPVAVKIFQGAGGLADGQRESALLQKLHHLKIPGFRESFFEDGRFVLVMEYRAGRTLEEWVRTEGGLSEEGTLRLGIGLCRVLDALHRRRPAVLYQDLKPANVLLRRGRFSAVVDFGCASFADGEGRFFSFGRGTRGYAAPEQFCEGAVLTAAADLYGLGGTLRYALGGRRASEGLERFLGRCQRSRPGERPASAGEAAAQLRRILWQRRLCSFGGRRLKRGLLRAGAAALLAAGACGIGGELLERRLFSEWERRIRDCLAGELDWEQEQALAEELIAEDAGQRLVRRGSGQTYFLELARKCWYGSAGARGKRLGGLLAEEGQACGEQWSEEEFWEAECYGNLFSYYERQEQRREVSAQEAARAAASLFRLFCLKRDGEGTYAQCLEIVSEYLVCSYRLSGETLFSGERKEQLIEIKNYLLSEKNDLPESLRERAEQLLFTAEGLAVWQ